MADIDITLYYNQHRLEAMERYLSGQRKRLEDELYPLVDALYEKLVPDVERGEIETRIAMENEKDRAETEAARRFGVIHLHQDEDDYYLMASEHRSFYDVAGLYRRQIQPNVGKLSLWDLTGRFHNADRILQSDFSRMYYQKLSGDPRITAVMVLNFDSGTISVCDNDGGLWKNYSLKDASTAIYKADRKNSLSVDERKELFDATIQRKLVSFFLDGDLDAESLTEEDQTENNEPVMGM